MVLSYHLWLGIEGEGELVLSGHLHRKLRKGGHVSSKYLPMMTIVVV